jgi:hypothetical protein
MQSDFCGHRFEHYGVEDFFETPANKYIFAVWVLTDHVSYFFVSGQGETHDSAPVLFVQSIDHWRAGQID